MLSHYLRPGKLWYVSDGFIWDDLPASYRVDDGRPLECSSKLLVFNPQGKQANVKVSFYHVDRPPTGVQLSVGAGEIRTLELATLPEIPHKQSFWIVIESDVPVLPQALQLSEPLPALQQQEPLPLFLRKPSFWKPFSSRLSF